MLKLPEKLVITATNLLMYYMIVEISYTGSLLITKLIVLGVEFKIPGKTSFASDGIVKLTEKTTLD